MMYQKKQSACKAIELTSEDILFLLSCIETSERQELKEPASEALYVRLVQRYVNLVKDRIEPITMLHEMQQLAN
jgi:hypothetical protein